MQHRIKYNSSPEFFFYLRRVHFDQKKQCMKDLASLGHGV